MSRPLIGSGQWSQTTTGIFHPADRIRRHSGRFCTGATQGRSARLELRPVFLLSDCPL